jgi:hypothetical protein
LLKIKEPNNYEIARNDPKWCKAMGEELYALEKIKRENFILCQVIKNGLDINEYIKLNTIVLIQYRDIRLD